MSSTTTTEMLQHERQRCITRLQEIGSESSRLIAELEALDMAILHLSGASQTTIYTGFRRAIDAVMLCLQRNDRVMTVEDIANEVADGGFRKGNDNAARSVMDSIDFHARRQGVPLKILRTIPPGDTKNDNKKALVGLYDWPDQKWAS